MPAFDLEPLLERDPRYPREAYDFLMEALSITQHHLGRSRATSEAEQHVSARELLEGFCQHAVAEFGLLAPAVLRLWGITETGDVGNLVFNLIEIDVLTSQPGDRREDFDNVFDLTQELLRDFAIHLEDVGS
jgi:uncharacterized repeat protein (TIGR04138 family)